MPIPMVAGGTIAPSRILKASTTADHKCLQATAGTNSHGDLPVGIAQYGTRTTPYPGLQDNNAAIAGEQLQVYQEGENAVVELGGSVAAGDLLKSDANGRAITAGTDGDFFVGRAAQAGALYDQIQCQVIIGMRGA